MFVVVCFLRSCPELSRNPTSRSRPISQIAAVLHMNYASIRINCSHILQHVVVDLNQTTALPETHSTRYRPAELTRELGTEASSACPLVDRRYAVFLATYARAVSARGLGRYLVSACSISQDTRASSIDICLLLFLPMRLRHPSYPCVSLVLRVADLITENWSKLTDFR